MKKIKHRKVTVFSQETEQTGGRWEIKAVGYWDSRVTSKIKQLLSFHSELSMRHKESSHGTLLLCYSFLW